MAEQAGWSVTAIQARQAALARRYSAVNDADRVLVDALVSAHAATVESAARLDAIAAEIDHAVQNQAALALDTPVGAREFQKFLLTKQREILAVVAHAHELDAAKKAALKALPTHYAVSAS
ncbi:DUF4226 domain-containing protein [Mycobacterium xenopi]|uniref:Biofilm regulator, BssS n=1 Tax=Mycobacterium xenopi TaxID=1789 RepID=A0AAD1LYZ5_MYCXE|nr:DUF4226 domain-containing protein [Mycobacterium xenopi]EUA43663.1 hypothetical protein I552_8410 [Mycobacterium xenopi 3993]EID15908.1 hypothetical protein MXEN_05515 [Mycobacterium xenopi RIVM700367]MDA3638690.1 DUF4226 domain-containing protein [Mycobacterium xenopi]MDA3656918.1 DUF4226 domain-containing protein [Mycobacterium xenopi]MDA3662342.1 DUF4226 domain-containing protein [Mycobacterium xenopi]